MDSDTELSESEDESKNPEENIRKDFEKYVQPIKDAKEELEMEFDGPATKLEPPPMQDSKEYYNNTMKPSDTGKQNPSREIFPIDEEESMRSSLRPSERSEQDKGPLR